MNIQELEGIERIYAACKAINKQLADAGFESVDAALEEIRSLREELEHQENYLEFYKGISSDALSICRELTDYIKRNNIPKNERISEIINTTKSRTYQVPEEIGVPYIVVCSKGTWFSHEYANCDHSISSLMIQMKESTQLKGACCDG